MTENFGSSDCSSDLEKLTRQRDAAIKHIAEWCVAIDENGSGWDDWDDYYKDAMYRNNALPEIRGLLDDAIASARKLRANEFSSQCDECGMVWHNCVCSHDDDDGC
jgi:hypothetical protein